MRLWLELLDRHLPGTRHGVTTRPGEEAELADRALSEGYSTLVAVGGDGTWSHVADRILASGRSDVRFGLLAAGTGNDFGRNLGLSQLPPAEAVQVLARGFSRRVDVGRVVSPSASPAHPGDPPRPTRHFLNLVGFGFDVAVIDAAAHARFLRGAALYKLTALQQLFRFPGLDIDVEDELGERRSGRHLMLTVSNGCYFGGGFPIAPGASVEDGRLHACMIEDAGPLERFRLFNLAEKGVHLPSPRVHLRGSTRFHVRAPEPPRFEIDGDVFRSGTDEVVVEVLPARLEVLAFPIDLPPRPKRET